MSQAQADFISDLCRSVLWYNPELARAAFERHIKFHQRKHAESQQQLYEKLRVQFDPNRAPPA